MKRNPFKLFAVLVIIVIAAGSMTAFAARSAAADTGVAGSDLQQIESSQVLAQSDTGYATSVADLVSVTTELGNRFPTRPGRALIIVASTDRQHYVSATKLSNGTMLVRGDEHREPVTCTSYSPVCIASLTADSSLINATPVWVTY
jgi:hypothetical protein